MLLFSPLSSSRKNKKYIIRGSEEVYDAFDEFEHANPMDPIEVRALSIDGAVDEGMKILQQKINQERFEAGFVSSVGSSCGQYGMYVARVDEVLDTAGNVLYKEGRKQTFFDTIKRYCKGGKTKWFG